MRGTEVVIDFYIDLLTVRVRICDLLCGAGVGADVSALLLSVLRYVKGVELAEEVCVRHLRQELFYIAGLVECRTVDIPQSVSSRRRLRKDGNSTGTIILSKRNHVAVRIQAHVTEHA